MFLSSVHLNHHLSLHLTGRNFKDELSILPAETSSNRFIVSSTLLGSTGQRSTGQSIDLRCSTGHACQNLKKLSFYKFSSPQA